MHSPAVLKVFSIVAFSIPNIKETPITRMDFKSSAGYNTVIYLQKQKIVFMQKVCIYEESFSSLSLLGWSLFFFSKATYFAGKLIDISFDSQ